MQSLADEGVVVVSAREYRKMCYLVNAYALYDEAHSDFKAWREAVAMTDGITVEARIDWRAVAFHVQPEILLVTATGKDITDFPVIAVLPESGQTIRIDCVVSVTVEEREDEKSELDVETALNALTTRASSLDGGKRENAMRQLKILKRILK